MDLWQAQQAQGMQGPRGGGGMDIPTAQSLGFTQSYPSLYAQKGGNLPMYQDSWGRIPKGLEIDTNLRDPGFSMESDTNFIDPGFSIDKWPSSPSIPRNSFRHRESWGRPMESIIKSDKKSIPFPKGLEEKIEKRYGKPIPFPQLPFPKDSLPYYQAANTFLPNAGDAPRYLQAGSFDRSSRTFAYQDPQTQPGEESYGMNPQALDFSNLPIASPTMNNANQNISTAPNMFMGVAQKGGNVHPNASFEAERGEVIEHPPGDPAIALEHGGTIRNANNYQKLTGNKHSDPEGGPQMTGAGGGFVYSDFLKMPKDLVEQLKYLT